jgi:hypothetical protein
MKGPSRDEPLKIVFEEIGRNGLAVDECDGADEDDDRGRTPEHAPMSV